MRLAESLVAIAPARTGRRLRVRHLGWALAGLASSVVVASRLLIALDPFTLLFHPGPPGWLWVTGEAVAPVFGVVTISLLGAVVVTRHPENLLGWAFLGTALVAALTLFCQEYAVYGLVTAPGLLPAATVAAWAQIWLYYALLLGLTLGLLLFPDGRLPNRLSRAVAVVAIVATCFALLDSLGNTQLLGTTIREESYQLPATMPVALWGIGSAFAWWTGIPVFWCQVLLLPLASLCLTLRLRRAQDEQRHQLTWVAFAGAIAAAGWLVSYADEVPHVLFKTPLMEVVDSWGDLVWTFGIMIAVPVAAGFAVLRYRLYEIDQVINRTLLVGGLAVFVAGVYATVVVGVGSAVHSSFGPALGLVAASIAAVGFAPVRARLQSLANRLVYGPRATPYEVLADFAERLGTASADDEMLGLMARLLGEGMGLERAEVWLRVGRELRLAASWPPEPDGAVTLALSQEELLPTALGSGRVVMVREHGDLLGALRVVKGGGDRLDPHEYRLLEDLARQAALVLRTKRLIEELRASRQRIVGSHDEVRRRLERDLHDGAQRSLVSASLALGIMDGQLSDGSVDGARQSLEAAADQLRRGLAELRDLARGIHPAILVESGLPAAIESLALRMPIQVDLTVTIDRRLARAVEISAYYFVAEALTNAVKHARASVVRVAARQSDHTLVIEVSDDGVGGADVTGGSGLRGLEDRLSAVGGRLAMESPPLGGTRLVAELPCA
jgi:signal transduction histidine kinase